MNRSLKKLVNKAVYHNDPDLLNNPFRKSQNYFILQVIFATIFTLLTGGVYISGFAIYLGASDEIVSYITTIPNICCIFLVIGCIFLEGVKSPKKAVVTMVVISKFFICSIVTIPLFVQSEMRQVVLLAVMIIAYIIQALYGTVLNKWFVSVVPDNIRGRYFSVRQFFALLVNVILPLITGRFMDTVADQYTGFIVLFSLGLLSMVVEVLMYLNIEEPPVESLEKGKIKIYDVVRIPLKNREFFRYSFVLFVFYLFLYLSASFKSVYMIRYLEMSYTFINFITILPAVMQMFMIRLWGRVSDKYGHKFVMNTSMWFFAAEALFWGLVSKTTMVLFIPVACIFSAIANSGFAVGAFNRRYEIIPEKGRTLYDGFYSAIVGVALLLAPILGGAVKTMAASNSFIKSNIQFGEFRMLFMITFISIIVLQIFNIRPGATIHASSPASGKIGDTDF